MEDSANKSSNTSSRRALLTRKLSLPNLDKLKDEYNQREAIPTIPRLAPGKLQIDLLNVRSDVSVKRPLMRLRMGSQHYFSSRSKHPNGNWNEGFLFTVSYHNQLFDTIELDLYDKRKKWRSKAKHIGKAKLKISRLVHRDDVFITFLPMYEYHVRRYLPAHIQLPHTFLKSHIMPNVSRFKEQYKKHYHHLQHHRQRYTRANTASNTTAQTNTIRKAGVKVEEDEDDEEEEAVEDDIFVDRPPAYQPHPSHSRHSMTPFIGSIQVRVRYSYQHPPDASSGEDFESDILSPVYFEHQLTHHSMETFHSYLTTSRKSSQKSYRSSTTTETSSSYYSNNSSTATACSPPTMTTATTAATTSSYHDAIEPKLVFVQSLPSNTSNQIPATSTTGSFRVTLPRSESFVDSMFENNLNKNSNDDKQDHHRHYNNRPTPLNTTNLHTVKFPRLDGETTKKNASSPITRSSPMSALTAPTSAIGHSSSSNNHRSSSRMSQMSSHSQNSNTSSSNGSIRHGKKGSKDKSASDKASIKSHNFGDKNFAFRWINESFEEVAISHPSLDRMIGMVVSPQTRILLRAVVKMFNAFGQGFKVTILQLISSLSLLQNFYSDVPRPPPAEKITDLKFLDEAYYFLGHAIIAYGWRGISYLGDYAKYLKDVVKTKSNKDAIVRYLKIPQEDLLGYEYGLRKGAVFQPSYFVSYDQVHEAVVLGIRGTWSLYDCITDLVCEYRPWKGGLVHSGILASAQWFFTRIIPQIFLYIAEQTKSGQRNISSFIITGHSLGAGAAAVLTMMVVDHLEQLRELSGIPDFKVHCYSYAPVASVSHDLSEKYKDYIDSFVCHDDLVARLSYGTASCAKELIMDACIAVDGLGGSSKVNNNSETRKACFDIIQARRKEIYHFSEPRYPLLYVPGTVYQFRRSKTSVPATKLSPQEMKLPGTTASSSSEQQQQQQSRPKATTTATAPSSPLSRPMRAFSTASFNNRRKSTPIFTSSHSESALPQPRKVSSSSGSGDPSPPKDEVTFSLHPSSSLLSEEILISKTCLEDHMVVTYLTAFQSARKNCMRQDSFRRQQNHNECDTDGKREEKVGSSSDDLRSTMASNSSSSTTATTATTATSASKPANIKLTEDILFKKVDHSV